MLPVLSRHLSPGERLPRAEHGGCRATELVDRAAGVRGGALGNPRRRVSQEVCQSRGTPGDPGGTSAELLRRKLRILQASGLVQTAAPYERPDQAHYTLTHKGTIVARLGEPVFLYLRLAEGWIKSAIEETATAETEASDKIDQASA